MGWIRGFRNVECVDVETKRRDRPLTTGVKDGDGTGVAFGGINVLLRDAFGQGAFLSGFHFVGVPSHDKVGIDDPGSLKNGESQFLQTVDNDGRGTKFRPPGFRVAVKRAAEHHHFVGVLSGISHEESPENRQDDLRKSGHSEPLGNSRHRVQEIGQHS